MSELLLDAVDLTKPRGVTAAADFRQDPARRSPSEVDGLRKGE
ncbi:hypothetical protein ACWEOE_41290 [Amycolatopsis sp. NPDC004368]